MALYIVVLPLLYIPLDSLRFAITDWAERRLLLPPNISWTAIGVAVRILVTALPFLAFPAIAVDAGRPLRQGVPMACRDFWPLAAVYLLGLIPWTLFYKLGLSVLVLLVGVDGVMILVDVERLKIASAILEAWTVTCTIALAAAAYRTLAGRETQLRTAAVFE